MSSMLASSHFPKILEEEVTVQLENMRMACFTSTDENKIALWEKI
eukprot:CAMPEP_0204891476 /NCGR_PEP_ID=MMETSP1349-20130617/27322_1 /ASSEMBLY_ACC=CAM_ASM_000710 /TAXON_ID=215587 /ORGANISM="Aplanochytrium stocchinoi, Strain GSBS06" /LENGTH=44 /DNA_ID= /DNA_START= /DNA_END= /DNA_ORIENTATION=